MNKTLARKLYTEKRNLLSSEMIEERSKQITEQCIHSDIWTNCKIIHIFISIPNKAEVDTSYLIQYFYSKHPNIKLCTSVVAENGVDLIHTYITPSTTYLRNKWNIPEPVERIPLSESEIDLVLLPLLAFDIKGNRVGYGKGFYDRFLQKCIPDVLKVGLSLFEAAEDLIEADTWDVPLDWGVTPKQMYVF